MDLDTTNLLLGIMAAVSVLEGLVLIGALVAGWKVYAALMSRLNDIEERHVAPLAARMNEIMSDVKSVTATIRDETERVDRTIHRTIDRADHAARWVRSAAAARASRVIGIVRGIAVTLDTLMAHRRARADGRT